MIVLAFTVKGPGVPKGRPRFTRQGRAYTPKATEDFEKWVRANAKQTMMKNGVRMIESGAVSAEDHQTGPRQPRQGRHRRHECGRVR